MIREFSRFFYDGSPNTKMSRVQKKFALILCQNTKTKGQWSEKKVIKFSCQNLVGLIRKCCQNLYLIRNFGLISGR